MKKIDRVGEKSKSFYGEEMTIIKYNHSRDMMVKFEGGETTKCTYQWFKNGYVMNPKRKNRVGCKNVNNQGHQMEIIEYNGCLDILVMFDNDKNNIVRTKYDLFKSGAVNNPNHIGKFGGIIGKRIGVNSNKEIKKSYDVWNSMHTRCNNSQYHELEPTYKDKYVCEDWIYYNKFKEWFDKNYYNLGEECMQLDKDILVKGNKVYSPETCIFVPQRINNLFTKTDAKRGEYPIGVYYKTKEKQLTSGMSYLDENGKKKYRGFGYFNTVEDAFNCYKTNKESYIKQVADEYKSKYPNFPQKLYDAMYGYEVEITD